MALICKAVHDLMYFEGGKDMQIENAGNINNSMNYQSKTVKAGEKQQFSPLEVREETLEDSSGQSGEMLSMLSEMSLDDWLQNMIQSGKANKIPVVNQIVTSKNPEDGNYYITYFTDDNISCEDALGKKVWELDISAEDGEKVKDYFKEFKPVPWAEELYYDRDNDMRMGMATIKDFWIQLLKK